MRRVIYCLIFIFSISSVFASPRYKVIDLGILDKEESMAAGINDKGEVCGIYRENGKPCSLFIWSASTGIICPGVEANMNLISIPPLGRPVPSLFINNKGQITGNNLIDNSRYICMWDPRWGLSHIVKNTVTIHGFNDAEEIVFTESGSVFVYKNGAMQNLGKLFDHMYGIQINNKSELWGTAMSSSGYSVARFYSLGEKRTYDVSNRIKSSFYGTGINDLGKSVVYWQSPDKKGLYIWSALAGTAYLCGMDPPRKINDQGQMIIGDMFFDRGNWFNINEVLELADDPSTPFERIESIYDINNKGQMVGRGVIKGKFHAVMIAPVE